MCPLSYMLHFITVVDTSSFAPQEAEYMWMQRIESYYGLILSLIPSPLHVLTDCTHSVSPLLYAQPLLPCGWALPHVRQSHDLIAFISLGYYIWGLQI